jgi:hypothetical protein
VDWVRPKLLAYNPLRIPSNQCTIVVNFYHDFMATNVFQGQTVRRLFYWPNHSMETQKSKEELEDGVSGLHTAHIARSKCCRNSR